MTQFGRGTWSWCSFSSATPRKWMCETAGEKLRPPGPESTGIPSSPRCWKSSQLLNPIRATRSRRIEGAHEGFLDDDSLGRDSRGLRLRCGLAGRGPLLQVQSLSRHRWQGENQDWGEGEDSRFDLPYLAGAKVRRANHKGDQRRVREKPQDEGLQRLLFAGGDRLARPIHPQHEGEVTAIDSRFETMEAAGIESASLHRIVGTRHDQSQQFRRLVGIDASPPWHMIRTNHYSTVGTVRSGSPREISASPGRVRGSCWLPRGSLRDLRSGLKTERTT